jgi:hypothetical protein
MRNAKLYAFWIAEASPNVPVTWLKIDSPGNLGLRVFERFLQLINDFMVENNSS